MALQEVEQGQARHLKEDPLNNKGRTIMRAWIISLGLFIVSSAWAGKASDLAFDYAMAKDGLNICEWSAGPGLSQAAAANWPGDKFERDCRQMDDAFGIKTALRRAGRDCITGCKSGPSKGNNEAIAECAGHCYSMYLEKRTSLNAYTDGVSSASRKCDRVRWLF